MKKGQTYTVELGKGTGLFHETIILMEMYLKGFSKEEFVKQVMDSNALAKVSEKRIRDVVKDVFYKRYVNENPEVPVYLKNLHKSGISLDQLIQIFLIYTARTNRILFDFIRDVYWRESRSNIETSEVRTFIQDAIRYGKIEKPWSDGTQKRVASYIIAALIDFKYINRKNNKISVFINDLTTNYLAHELHFKGFTDESVVQAEEWGLFGYDRYDTIKHLERLSYQGHFILQNSGEIIKITWHYQSMKDFIDANTRH